MKKIAIYCPFYITDNNQGSWIESWIQHVYKYEKEHDIFFSITYPTDPKKWDVCNEGVIIDNTSIDIASKINTIGIDATVLFNLPNITHWDALNTTHKKLKSLGYEYMVHIEQDVILHKEIANTLISVCEQTNNDICITNTVTPSMYGDIDISVFCINLQQTEYTNTLYDPVLCDLNIPINIWHNKQIKPFSRNVVYEDYKNLFYIIFNNYDSFITYTERKIKENFYSNAYDNVKPWLSKQLINSIKQENIVFFDVARRLLMDNALNNTLAVYKNDGHFIHIGWSRCKMH